jgi:hypothetical protein
MPTTGKPVRWELPGSTQPGEHRASETGAAYDEPVEATTADSKRGRPGLGSETPADETGASEDRSQRP